MDGLDRVKGPHWSQILALYGAGGSISEVLKDRNQVQLKDKARNLKLFFLKSGIEVPVYLQRVTGELKTRAPAQAAKREAKERLKALEEERARLGLQPGEPLPPDREQAILNQRRSSA
jgi:protein TBF1